MLTVNKPRRNKTTSHTGCFALCTNFVRLRIESWGNCIGLARQWLAVVAGWHEEMDKDGSGTELKYWW
jgi:hypothetical protein